ncbi:hypothetical protein QM012_008212 [Aureobasidium pullulans]|uniref:Myb-like domain-containing protein n=1 Tax=Aureobasidium pullulans TaxID=5580 RepID=A0ABR0TIT0_AURPU
MSEIETDIGSVRKDDDRINNFQEDSGSEYEGEGEDDDQSDDAAYSVRSGRSETSNGSKKSGPLRKSGSPKKSKSKGHHKPLITKSTKATYSDAYRDFYNAEVEELIHPFHSITHALPASEVGVTVWTPLEKERLFQKVSALGKDDIKGISSAIRTKSETEVRQYLSLLDLGTAEGNVTKALPVFSAADVSPAFEVSKQSEELLEEYANGLARYQMKSDQKREKKRHGDYWLLTEDIAQDVEEQVMAHDESYKKSGLYDEDENKDGEEDHDLENAKSDQEAANTDAESGQEEPETDVEVEPDSLGEATARTEEQNQQLSESLEDIMVPSAELLDLPMWLRLSRLFMYQSSELGDSWDTVVTSGHETPSMYHTAFQDFHNLTVSLTRRVVQATIFQTMTRLRARDKDQPSARVTTTDVRAATEILDLQPNTRKFWAGLPRRHGLRVYERGSKSSRSQSRAGVELSIEEAEERLGTGHASILAEAADDVAQTIEIDLEDVLDPDQYYNDPELWTEASDTENETPIEMPDNQNSDASEDDEAAYQPTDDEEAQDAARKKRRRKGRLERNFQKAHDAYLEAVDQEISRVQEVELWDTLGVAPPSDVKNEEVEIPRQPVIKRRLSDTVNWRDDCEYHSPWELGFDTVQSEAFASMRKRGEQARKRRRMAYEHLEQEGLIVLPQQAPEVTVVKKIIKPTHADTDMTDAPTAEIPTATETFDDGVPRKKRPAPIHKALSRASSVREGSHESFVSERSKPTNLTLLNKLTQRMPAEQIEQSSRRAEEERQAEERRRQVEEQVREEKRKARAARKALSEEEKLAFDRERQEERARKAQESRRNDERKREKQEQEERERLADEEKRKVQEEKRRVREDKRMAKIEKRKVEEVTNIEQQGDATRSAGPRSKKPKRKSGF